MLPVHQARLVELQSFEPDQVHSFLVNYYESALRRATKTPGPQAEEYAEVQQLADHRMALIRDVQDLQGLSA